MSDLSLVLESFSLVLRSCSTDSKFATFSSVLHLDAKVRKFFEFTKINRDYLNLRQDDYRHLHTNHRQTDDHANIRNAPSFYLIKKYKRFVRMMMVSEILSIFARI